MVGGCRRVLHRWRDRTRVRWRDLIHRAQPEPAARAPRGAGGDEALFGLPDVARPALAPWHPRLSARQRTCGDDACRRAPPPRPRPAVTPPAPLPPRAPRCRTTPTWPQGAANGASSSERPVRRRFPPPSPPYYRRRHATATAPTSTPSHAPPQPPEAVHPQSSQTSDSSLAHGSW